MSAPDLQANTPSIWIPQANPGANYLAHRQEIDSAIHRVLESGWYIQGSEVNSFEAEFARYLGIGQAVGVASGTDALELSLRALGVAQGDAVFTVSHTAVATVAAIRLAGGTPVLVDIDPASFTIDPGHLEDKIKDVKAHTKYRLKAVIPVHLYGCPADMPAIQVLAKKYDLFIVEDCAQSHGAHFFGKKTGTWGDVAAFSFYPTKNLGALGDGGAVVTGDRDLAQRIRLLAQYGWENRYVSSIEGQNSRLDEIQAAILRIKLRYLDQENKRRIDLANLYRSKLAHPGLVLPSCGTEAFHVYHQFVIRTPDQASLRSHLERCRIRTAIHYPVPVHLQPAYAALFPRAGDLVETEKAAREIVSLPIYPELTPLQLEQVVNAIADWNSSKS